MELDITDNLELRRLQTSASPMAARVSATPVSNTVERRGLGARAAPCPEEQRAGRARAPASRPLLDPRPALHVPAFGRPRGRGRARKRRTRLRSDEEEGRRRRRATTKKEKKEGRRRRRRRRRRSFFFILSFSFELGDREFRTSQVQRVSMIQLSRCTRCGRSGSCRCSASAGCGWSGKGEEKSPSKASFAC